MQDLLNLLFWAGTTAGGLLILLLLLSIFGSMDIGGDADIDASGGAADSNGGASDAGLGLLKTILTFISVGTFTARAIFLNTSWSWTLVILSSLAAGSLAVIMLTWFFRWLLKNQEKGNWQLWQAEGKIGSVYVPIPTEGKGRITVQIDNALREIAAKSVGGQALGTHEKVMVIEAKEDYVIVAPLES